MHRPTRTDLLNPSRRIADLEKSLAHQRELTSIERRRAEALEQQVRVAWQLATRPVARRDSSD